MEGAVPERTINERITRRAISEVSNNRLMYNWTRGLETIEITRQFNSMFDSGEAVVNTTRVRGHSIGQHGTVIECNCNLGDKVLAE